MDHVLKLYPRPRPNTMCTTPSTRATTAGTAASPCASSRLLVPLLRTGLWSSTRLALLARHKERDTYVGQLEAAAAAAAFFSIAASWLTDRPVMHYIDNQGALYSLINGRSEDADCNRLVFVTLMRAMRLRCDVWFDYVPSASNFADLPTRLDDAAFARLERVARRVPFVLPPEWCLDCPHAELRALFDGV